MVAHCTYPLRDIGARRLTRSDSPVHLSHLFRSVRIALAYSLTLKPPPPLDPANFCPKTDVRCTAGQPQEVTRTEDGRVVFSPEWDTPGPAAAWGRQLAGGGGGKVDDNFYYNAFLGFTGQLEQILAAVSQMPIASSRRTKAQLHWKHACR